MAVTNNATLIEDHETAPSYTSIGGGQGAASNANFYFRGVLSSFRKMSGVTKNGFWFSDGTQHDISAAGTHVKMFINAITQAGFTDFWIRIGPSQTVYEEHNPGVVFYDNDAGGWIPIWVEVGAGVDTGSPTFTAVDEWAVICSMNTISGNVKNFGTDQSHYSTRPVLTWDGTGGDLDDFITTELSAGVGCLKVLNGLYTCYANLKIGSATATGFDAAGKTIAFPDATWLPAASTWMGLDFDLQNASTDLDWSGGSVISGNPTGASARKPDIIVTGTAGALDFTSRLFDGMRIMTLTSGVDLASAVIKNTGLITAGEANFAGAILSGSTVAVDEGAVFDDRTTTASTILSEYDGVTFVKGANAHHALRFGVNVDDSITLRNCEFTGWGSSTNDANDSIFRFDATSGAIDLNLVNCTVDGSAITTGTATIDDAAGITVTPVIDPKTLTITVKDKQTLAAIQNVQTSIHLKDSPFTALMNEDTTAGGVATESYTGTTPVDVVWKCRKSDDLDNPRYFADSGIESITADGLNITVLLAQNPFLT